MKNQILDDPIRDSFADFLEKGETILWRGNPQLNNSIFDIIVNDILKHLFGVILILFFLTIYFMELLGMFGGFVIFSIFLIIQHFWVVFKNKKKKQTLYAISQKRIFFSFTEQKETIIHTIEFQELNNFIINQDKINNKSRTFFLSAKNPKSILFTTYNFKNNDRRHQPTLELIEDHQAVSKLLEEGIKNVNTLL